MRFRSILEKGKEYGPVANRLGMSAVFLWFGINQLFVPENFVGYLPEFLFRSEYATMVVVSNGVFETLFGLLLVVGLFTRVAAFLLAIHLVGITIEIGYNDLGIRDFGLTVATIAIFLYGPDSLSLDRKWRKKQ